MVSFQKFYGISHVLLICFECARYVEEIYCFYQKCIKNNVLLKEYIEKLRLDVFGNDIGNAVVKINDVMDGTRRTTKEKSVPDTNNTKTAGKKYDLNIFNCFCTVIAN